MENQVHHNERICALVREVCHMNLTHLVGYEVKVKVVRGVCNMCFYKIKVFAKCYCRPTKVNEFNVGVSRDKIQKLQYNQRGSFLSIMLDRTLSPNIPTQHHLMGYRMAAWSPQFVDPLNRCESRYYSGTTVYTSVCVYTPASTICYWVLSGYCFNVAGIQSCVMKFKCEIINYVYFMRLISV